ncbi:hypothetical protein G6F40_017708 [Rhizopus arrhizus]|nr:hypothetical protein G6F40_017708 [Rhizopus arrhizus]
MMAFQAGGPHAQDRGFEAVTYAWQEMSRIPGVAIWEKPRGKNDPIRMEKQFTVVPRGVWHRLHVACPGKILFVTPGHGSEHRRVAASPQ